MEVKVIIEHGYGYKTVQLYIQSTIAMKVSERSAAQMLSYTRIQRCETKRSTGCLVTDVSRIFHDVKLAYSFINVDLIEKIFKTQQNGYRKKLEQTEAALYHVPEGRS